MRTNQITFLVAAATCGFASAATVAVTDLTIFDGGTDYAIYTGGQNDIDAGNTNNYLGDTTGAANARGAGFADLSTLGGDFTGGLATLQAGTYTVTAEALKANGGSQRTFAPFISGDVGNDNRSATLGLFTATADPGDFGTTTGALAGFFGGDGISFVNSTPIPAQEPSNNDDTDTSETWSVTFTVDSTSSLIGQNLYFGTASNLIQNGGSEHFIGDAEVNFVAVPEPSSAALIGLGGLALVLRRRK